MKNHVQKAVATEAKSVLNQPAKVGSNGTFLNSAATLFPQANMKINQQQKTR